MNKKIAAVIAIAAFGFVQAHALAFENLPEANVGDGTRPGLTSGTIDSFIVAGTDADDADEANMDNMPEPNIGDGTK